MTVTVIFGGIIVSGEFSTQTCFQGRFGEEMGSDQFGATIMVNQLEKDTQVAQAHLEYVEVTHAGQAFRIGRYAVHFHLNGDMSNSYVKGCAVHESFNRAINLHGAHNMDIRWNVVYNIMGGAIFLEDGIETGNTFDSNLAIFVRTSSSLLNFDITPAAFWITNPANFYRNNCAAGGTHFGFWYQLNEHPGGPSLDESICLRRIPLGEFSDNTAHSNGWYGLWVYEEFLPQFNGNCHASAANVVPAEFERLVSWNNDKGAEFAGAGSLRFVECVFVQNNRAGVEIMKTMNVPKRSEKFCGVINSVIVGHTNSLALQQAAHEVTDRGFVIPFGHGRIQNTKFINFDAEGTSALFWTSITGLCTDHCGGWPFEATGLSFSNVLHLGMYRWPFEGILEDLDGTVCGSGESVKILPKPNTTLPPECTQCLEFDSRLVEAMQCPFSMRFHTWAFKVITPRSLYGKNFWIRNQYGTALARYMTHRVWPYKPGYEMTLVDGETYLVEFENGEHITNITFVGEFTEFSVSQ